MSPRTTHILPKKRKEDSPHDRASITGAICRPRTLPCVVLSDGTRTECQAAVKHDGGNHCVLSGHAPEDGRGPALFGAVSTGAGPSGRATTVVSHALVGRNCSGG